MREFNQAQIDYADKIISARVKKFGKITWPQSVDLLRYRLGHERAEAEQLLRKVLEKRQMGAEAEYLSRKALEHRMKGNEKKMPAAATAPAQAQPTNAYPRNVAQFKAYMAPGVRVRCVYRYYRKDQQQAQVLTVSRVQSNGMWFKPVPPETRESWAEFPPAKRISFSETGYEITDPTRAGFVLARYEWMLTLDEEARQREAAKADLAFEIRELEGLEASANDPTEASKMLAAAWAKMRKLEAADHA